tara:strand:+ start:410 stop:1381 length:972 start_codon:yes stop_codon:yes gene_type:complete
MNGLQNLGNTCYLNTIVQCVNCLPLLTKSICETSFTPSIQNIPGIIVTQFKIILFNLNTQPIKTVVPHQLIKALEYFIQQADSGKNSIYTSISDIRSQNDAHEFLILLLNIFHETFKDKVNIHISGEASSLYDKEVVNAMNSFKRFHENEYSCVTKFSTGQYISTLHNTQKNTISTTYEPFTCVELEIPPEPEITVYDCLNHFTQNEKLSTGQYKSIQFWKLPQYLILTLKRFDGLSKNNKHVKIDTLINLQNYCVGPERFSSSYKLVAVANHTGSLDSGHYYAYCFSEMEKKWYVCNDSSTRQIRQCSLSTSHAYCLFYDKI